MKIAWVTDSTVYIDENLKQRDDFFVVPMSIVLDQKEYNEGINITTFELFEKLRTLKSPPKSSQPAVGTFQELYQSLQEDYEAIFSIHLSSQLSGTYNSAYQASKMVDIPVYVIDSKIISYPLSYIIKYGMKLEEAVASIDEMKMKIESFTNQNEAYVMVGSLEQLHRGGRLGGLQFFIGNLMNIKPIISFDHGALFVKDKVRSFKKAFSKITGYLENTMRHHSIKEVFILYGLHDGEARSWKDQLQEKFPNLTFNVYPLGSVIGIHAGEETLGISWFHEV